MLVNYLKIAFRNLLKHKLFSLINIFGLSVGFGSVRAALGDPVKSLRSE